MRLRTLGELILASDDGTEVLRGRRRELLLLAYLARRSPRKVPRADLATLFWHDRPADRARLSLRQTLFKLRQLVPTGVEVSADDVGVDRDAVSLDVARLEAAVSAARFDLAASEVAGEFLPEAENAGGEEWRVWLEGERAAIRNLSVRALEGVIAEAVARGAWNEAAGHALRLSESMPDDVPAHRRVVEMLSLAGREAEASARHAAFLARQGAEGEAPTPELEAIGARLARVARTAPASPGSAGLFSPDMVGRGDDFAALAAAWAEARTGREVIVVVEGESGIGKTRLVGEFLRTIARSRGSALRLHARAYGHDRMSDLAIARELLAPLAGARGLVGAPAEALAGLSALVPAVREQYPHLPQAPGDDRQIAAAVARVIADVSTEQPVVMVVDDLPAADPASQRLVLGVLRRLVDPASHVDGHAPALLAVLTTRPGAISRADLRDATPPRWIRLRPLEDEEVRQLVSSMLELPPDDEHALARWLHAETAGNPFDAIEIVSALVDEGKLETDESGAWRLGFDVEAEGAALPHSAREALIRRIDRLDRRARRLLGAAAHTGKPFGTSDITSLTGFSDAEGSAALDQLLLRRLVQRASAAGDRFEVAHPLIAELVSTAAGATGTPALRTRRRFLAAAAAIAAVAVIAIIGSLVFGDRLGARPTRVPAIVIAGVTADSRDSNSVWLAEGVASLIEARLSQTESLEPIASERVVQAIARAGFVRDSLTPDQAVMLARRLDAQIVATARIERVDTTLLLDLEIRDASDGDLMRRVVVEGHDALELADAAAVQLWQSVGAEGSGRRLAEVTTRSAEAYRQFMRSRAAQSAGRAREQREALDAAIALDSGFGSALIERIAIARGADDQETVRRLTAAFEHHRARIPPRDRMQWSAAAALRDSSPERAEAALLALVRRYPRDPRAYRDLAGLRAHQGRWDEAEAVLRRALAIDSSALQSGQGVCSACMEYVGLVGYRMMQGDRRGAEDAARRLVGLAPGTAGAWVEHALVHAAYGRPDSAVAAMGRAMSLGGDDPWLQLLHGRILIMNRQLVEVDSLVASWRASGSPELEAHADDLESVAALERGDVARALDVMNRALARDSTITTYKLVRAHLIGRMGRHAEADRQLEEQAHGIWQGEGDDPDASRTFAWHHALLADAIAGSGDTIKLRALADSIERIGARSYYGRDWTLHHHVRGLIAMHGGRHDEAAREFEAARFGRPGWTRTVVELAKAHLAAGRPQAAIDALRPGYEGWPDAMARYAPRSELDRLMARAFMRMGQRDSAAIYERHLRSVRRR